MNRILCIHLPNWPVQRIVVARPELKGRPLVLYAHVHPRGQRVVTCCAEASRQGIRVEMPVAEAKALVERLEDRGQGAGEGSKRPAEGAFFFSEYDPIADREALVQLARWCERFSPLVGLEDVAEPTDLLFDITGLAAIFGSEERLTRQVAEGFQSRGYRVQLGVADTIGAAWAVTHFARARDAELSGQHPECGASDLSGDSRSALPIPHSAFVFSLPVGHGFARLHGLPVAALRLSPQTLDLLGQLGIERIGELVALPRESLSARFGTGLAKRLDQAAGRVEEVITAERPVEGFRAEWALEYPTHNRAAIEIIVTRLVERVACRLAECDEGVIQLECCLVCGKQPLRTTIGLFEPTASAAHLMQLVRMQLERFKLSQPVREVRVQATTTTRLVQQQNELFAGDTRRWQRQLTALVDRLSSRLGRHSVVRARPLDDPQPERSWRYIPLAGQRVPHSDRRRATARRRKAKSPAAQGALSPAVARAKRELTSTSRPLRLHAPPASLEVIAVVPDGPPVCFALQSRQYRITRHWGPERIETGWWRGRSVCRDYYRVETETGHRFWLFRRLDDGAWFLHGEFE